MRFYKQLAFVLLTLLSSSVIAQTEVVNLSHVEFAEKVSGNVDAVVIDVRSAQEFAIGRVPGAINIAHGDILKDSSLLDEHKGKDLIFYCRSGVRARRVTDMLVAQGFTKAKPIFHLQGDMLGWEAAKQLVEK
jgi:rhodanese-related sulfurtransferase